MILNQLKRFFTLEAASGILIFMAAVLAMLMENSPLYHWYDAILTTPVAVQIGTFEIHKPLLLWINDGFMAVFFLLVGLEIKREVLMGELSSPKQILLPAVAAMGGLVFPALIYIYLNYNDPTALRGWAIPTATDIAFALAVMNIMGSRISEKLKLLLLTIAIIDDLAAIIIIALFYTSQLSLFSMFSAAGLIVLLAYLNYKNVSRISAYMVLGVLLWVCVLKSGIHATLAGVILAMFIPIKTPGSEVSLLHNMENSLHPWVAYLILPLFAFANAGVSLAGISLSYLSQSITLGIVLGLFVGKQLGVMATTFVATLLGICRLPEGITWPQFYGLAVTTGIGFTMSLFIGTLAFTDITLQTAVRIGVLLGSLLSATVAYLVLLYTHKAHVASSVQT